MGGGGFWVFLAIIVINLVIQVIRKSAEKRALKAAASPVAGPSAAPTTGEHEVVLERVGDARLEVVKLLRGDLGFSLQAAMAAVEEAPTVLVTDVARGPAGMLRSRLEAVGASASIRRSGEARSGGRLTGPAATPRVTSAEAATSGLPRSIDVTARSVPGTRTFEVAKKAWEERIDALRRSSPPTPSEPTPSRVPVKSGAVRERIPGQVATPPAGRGGATGLEVAPKFSTPPATPRPPQSVGPEGSKGPDLSRLLGRDGLRDAFIVQELLRSPLALRPGMGGRDS